MKRQLLKEDFEYEHFFRTTSGSNVIQPASKMEWINEHFHDGLVFNEKVSGLFFFLFIILMLSLSLTLSGCRNEVTVYESESESESDSNSNSKSNIEYVKSIDDAAKKLSGDIDWGVHCYGDDFQYISDSKSVPSASVIKLFIMEYAFHLESSGKLSMDEAIQGTTVSSLLEKMITESDNAATNILIDKFGMPELNRFFAEESYTDTKLERKMLDTEAMQQGKDNYTSVKDVLNFLDKIYANKNTYPYSEMLDIMKRQTNRNKIPAKIPGTVAIASKTGELDNVENDIGIVFTEKSDVAMVFLCTSLSDCEQAREFISDSAYLIYQWYD